MTDNRKAKRAAKRNVRLQGRGKSNEHNRDISSKKVFRDPVLCAQFFRDNFDIPELKNVQPEDITDISERYIPYLGTEFDSDSVKKIRILDIGQKGKTDEENQPPFFVSLIDHKSLVDYDVSMQLLRYMMCIWTEYRREMETKREGCTRSKAFRYPVIIPIVYYEGKASWTADRHLAGRIGRNPEYQEWIPDFKYEVIRIHDYSDDELLERGNEMALVMLMNKVQDGADLEKFIRIPGEALNRIVRNSPGHVMDVLASVMESLCFKIDASEEERTECVRKVRKREMGYLFENMEHISLRELRQKIEEGHQEVESVQQKLTGVQQELTDVQQELKSKAQELKSRDQELKSKDQELKSKDQELESKAQELKSKDQELKSERERAADAEEKLKIAEATIKQLLEKTKK